ncbi:hypothetical protein N865_08160 [Intrasporangium oryzae NRRL B-24470]|uniref:DUF2231 domain-containing protein n=1 Tax=Intrasporangium oryzae NRRL B-24470 TaxID=1386089 RepID=W9GAF6_9MICO|nr:DUF2231 domain-containing protein [Intrasporangium oryzae]EWT01823.1 hypothetical protein N865_08160 [Intrasporangium oryzae NRRL B-24470]
MFDLVLGLPVHALVVHAVVVLVPLAAGAAVAYVLRPRWRHLLRWPTGVGALVAGATAFVAAESGEKLLVRVAQTRASTTDFGLLQQHVDWGNRAKIACALFLMLALGAVWLVRPPDEEEPRSRPLEVLVSVVVVLASIAAVTTVVLAGHAGSKVVWSGLG